MDKLMIGAAFVTSLLSALACYAGSPHCRWQALHRWRGKGGWLGLALAGLSLWLWVLSLGAGAGLCAMLGTWMLALMVVPCLGALGGAGPVANRNEP
jgi:hypothetical protein